MSQHTPSPPDRPNVLLLSVDDMNDWVGFLGGYPGVETPNMDALARRGVAFCHAHCPSPLCNPSRAAILSGLAPWRSGVYHNNQWWRPNRPDVQSLPEAFRAAGYETAGAGKVYHHTPGNNPPEQWDQYFHLIYDDPWDRPESHLGPQQSTEARPHWHPANGITPARHEFDWGALDKPESHYGDVRGAAWAAQFIKQPRDRPFFLAFGTFAPHLPWYCPQPYFDRYPRRRITLPALADAELNQLPEVGRQFAAHQREDFDDVRAAAKWEDAVQAYLARISFADAQLGRVLDALNESGQQEHTIVVLYSDNGFHLGEKRHWHKMTLWERGTHVPLAICAPGVTTAAGRCHHCVSLQDIYPTLVDLCSLAPPPQSIDGKSLRPWLNDPDTAAPKPAVINYLRGNYAVRAGHWRYIRYHDGGEELYNRAEDPDEAHNLAHEQGLTGMIRELRAHLPADDAADAPNKERFEFDPVHYTWRDASASS